jgi:spore coat polysaccharide biosynthesis predicted glycosyltransferase SpsG
MKKILYILNCSDYCGTGHLRRFISINNYFKEYGFYLLIKKEIGTLNIINKFKNDFNVLKIFVYQDDLLNELINNSVLQSIKYFFFDAKNIDEKVYKYLKIKNKFILSFDDTSVYAPKYVDILFDANIHISSNNNLYYGSKYIIFNKNILNIKRKHKNSTIKPKNIFVCFGGTDPKNYL